MDRNYEFESILSCLLESDNFKAVFESSDEGRELVESVAWDIENSVLGQTEKKALKKHILKSDSKFAEIYSCVSYNIKVNLDKNSTVNRSKPAEVGSYLANSIFANMMTRASVDAMTESGCDWVDQKLASSLLDSIPNIDPSDVGGMSSVQLNPLINREFTDEIKKREAQKYSEKYSTMYTCFKCKGKKTKEQEVQKRSLDEGGTLIVTCLICGNRWSP